EAATQIDNASVGAAGQSGLHKQAMELVVVVLAHHHEFGAEFVDMRRSPRRPDTAGLQMNVPIGVPVGETEGRIGLRVGGAVLVRRWCLALTYGIADRPPQHLLRSALQP